MFPPFEKDDGTRTCDPDNFVEDVVPEGGTLVLLMSDDVEHSVRTTRAERECVVGWFNEYKEEREPDWDEMSLHT